MLSITNGYVVYERSKDSKTAYWQNIYLKEAGKKLKYSEEKTNKNNNDHKTRANKIRALASAERAKEVAFLQARFADLKISSNSIPANVKDYIQYFNDILRGEDAFKKVLQRLDAQIKYYETIQTAKGKNAKVKGGPNIAFIFQGYFQAEINRQLESGFKIHNPQNIEKEIEQRLIIPAVYSAIENIKKMDKSNESNNLKRAMYFSKKNLNIEEEDTGEDWDFLLEDLKKGNAGNSLFYNGLRDLSSFKKLKEVLTATLSGQMPTGEQNDTVKTYFKNQKLQISFSSNNGGLYSEVIQAVQTQLALKMGGSYSVASNALSSNIRREDMTIIISPQGNNADALLKDYDTMTKGKDLEEVRDKIEQFYNDNLKNLKGAFIVHRSSKSYFFFQDTEFGVNTKSSLSSLRKINYSVNQLINLANNTIPGAIYHDQRNIVKKDLEEELSTYISNLLFDDWISIGGETGSGIKSLHVLDLEDISVPLSCFLYALADAMENMDYKKIANVKVTLPSAPILYKDPIQAPAGEPHLTLKYIEQKWEEQKAATEREGRYNFKFYKNFYNIVAGWIKN